MDNCIGHIYTPTLMYMYMYIQLPHRVGMGMWTPGSKVQCKKTADCVIGLSRREFPTVINGLSAIIVDLIQVSMHVHT